MDRNTEALFNKVASLGEMSEEDALRIVQEVYRDGIVSRDEAESLYRLHPKLKHVDPNWTDRFIEMVRDYLVENEAPHGWVSEEECTWLLDLTGLEAGTPTEFDVALLISVLRKTEGAPSRLAEVLLRAMVQTIKAAGSVSSERVEELRAILFAPTGHEGLWVSRFEAQCLFEINDAVASARNATAWDDFFAKAIGNHLMARAHPSPQSEAEALAREKWLGDTSVNVGGFLAKAATSFFEGNWWQSVLHDTDKSVSERYAKRRAGDLAAQSITTDEQDWVHERLGWDQRISPAEKALIAFLKSEVPGFAESVSNLSR